MSNREKAERSFDTLPTGEYYGWQIAERIQDSKMYVSTVLAYLRIYCIKTGCVLNNVGCKRLSQYTFLRR